MSSSCGWPLFLRKKTVGSRHGARLEALDRAIDDAARTVARVRELGKSREDSANEPVQLREIIAQAIDLARSSIEGRPSLNGQSIQMTSHLPGALPSVMGPASDLRQVFLNLLLNAADAIPHRGEIEIASSVEDDMIVVRVSDNGTGIPAEHIGRIFEPFFTTKGPHGTGLGLSTAREVVEGIGGSISATNRPGGGAVFELRFPIARTSDHTPEPSAVAEASGGCRFLLIDDDADNLDSLRENLVRRGHQADTALSGAAAMDKLRSGQPYDIVLCDLAMPGMNGWEVARKAREIIPDVDFYIVTGWGREIEREIPASVSISGLLCKPIDLNEIARIAAIVRQRPARPAEIAAAPGQASRQAG
jgi:CheY-like chemotaxis protein